MASTVLEPAPTTRTHVSEAWAADIEIIEAEGGHTQAELDSLVWQVDFAVAVTTIQEEHPESYTSSWLDQETGQFWVSVPGRLDEAVETILRSVPTRINVVESIGWSETEITGALQAVHFAVLAEPGVSDASTGANPLTGSIEVDVAVGRSSKEAIDRITRVANLEIPSSGPFSVSINFQSGGGGGLDWLQGGSSLGNGCTAAFSVRSASYSNGILSADHCGDNPDVDGNNLTYRWSVPLALGDVEWYSNNQPTYAGFRVNASTTRGVTGSANPVDGNTYCRYGRTTGSQCDSVYMLNRCRSGYCNPVMMFNREADGGDSGGPWFAGSVAFGVHSGYVTYLTLRRDVWSPIRTALSELSITLKTS